MMSVSGGGIHDDQFLPLDLKRTKEDAKLDGDGGVILNFVVLICA